MSARRSCVKCYDRYTAVESVGSVGSVGVAWDIRQLPAVWCGAGRGCGWVSGWVTRAGERERTDQKQNDTWRAHTRTVTEYSRLAHPLHSQILAFMLPTLGLHSLYTLPSLQHRLATSAISSSSSFIRSSSSSSIAMSRSASSPSASCSRFPRALLPRLLPNPCLVRRAHLASLRCRVVSLAWPSEAPSAR